MTSSDSGLATVRIADYELHGGSIVATVRDPLGQRGLPAPCWSFIDELIPDETDAAAAR